MEVQQQQPVGPIDPFGAPTIDALSTGPLFALHAFMRNLDLLLKQPQNAVQLHCGAFELLSEAQGLQLQKLPAPVYVERDSTDIEEELLPTACSFFGMHGDLLLAPIWEGLCACGQADYLHSHAGEYINDDWRIVANVNPYFGRSVVDVGLHKDTPGNLLFFMLLFCNESAMLGPEYLLRPPLVPAHEKLLEQSVQPAFLAEIRRRLQQPTDRRLYVAHLKPWGIFGGCDELLYHSTPYLHHRGAYLIAVLWKAAQVARETYFSPAYQYSRKAQDPHWQPTPKTQVEQGIAALEQRSLQDCAVDEADVPRYFPAADFRSFMLADPLPREDPFRRAVINTSAADHVVDVAERDKKLTRQVSEELDQGKLLTRPEAVSFLRVWVTAERRHPPKH